MSPNNSTSATELLVFISIRPTSIVEACYVPAAMLGAEVTEKSKTLAVPAREREREFRQP